MKKIRLEKYITPILGFFLLSYLFFSIFIFHQLWSFIVSIDYSTTFYSQIYFITSTIFGAAIFIISFLIIRKLLSIKNEYEILLNNSKDELNKKIGEVNSDFEVKILKLKDEINDRIKSENILKESENRFRRITGNVPVMIWTSGTDRLCNYFNNTWLEYTGKQLEDEIGNGWVKGVHPDDYKTCFSTFITSFEKREKFEMEFKLKTNSGQYKWVQHKGIPIYDNGNFAGYIGTCVDVHERKINEIYGKLQNSVSKILANTSVEEKGYNEVLKTICIHLNWDIGLLWKIDSKNKDLKLAAMWGEDPSLFKKLTEIYDPQSYYSNEFGLPGQVSKINNTFWTDNLNQIPEINYQKLYSRMGLHTAFAIPITDGNSEIISVLECFNKNTLDQQDELLDRMKIISHQIGIFMERKKAEYKLIRSHSELEDKVKERTAELANTLNKLIDEIKEKEQLQTKLKLFAHAIKDIKECVFITDLNNNVLFANEAFEEIFGYFEDDLLGKEVPIFDKNYIHPQLKKDILYNTLRGGWKGNIPVASKDGYEFNIYLSTSIIRNDEGKIEALVGICQDVTGIKKTEELINKRNNLLHLLNDVILVTNKSFDWNEAISEAINKICDYTKWDIGHCLMIKGDHFESNGIWNKNLENKYLPFKELTERTLFPKSVGLPGRLIEDGKSLWINIEELNDYTAFKRIIMSKNLGLKTGIWIPILTQTQVIGAFEFFKADNFPRDGEIMECLKNIGMEIGSFKERLETIENIKTSDRLLNQAQNIARLGSWEIDQSTGKQLWSEEMYRIFGINMTNIEPDYKIIQSLVHPDDLQKVLNAYEEIIGNPGPKNLNFRIVTKQGRLKYLFAEALIDYDEYGKPKRFYGSVQDITEQKLVEDELRKTNAKLLETQKELIDKEKLAALGRFSSGIAHEIRNPLANISALSQLVIKADVDEKLKKHLKYILINSDIANKIIKDLLNYAAPEDLVFNFENIAEIIDGIIESVKPRTDEHKITIKKQIQSNIPLLYIDKLKIENSFLNFISNSIDAMSEGGDLILRVNENKVDNTVEIEFIDSGIGIPVENLDKVFEPFFTTKKEGTGLGMGLAYHTIKSHDGSLTLTSSEGKGTHIKIKLPIRKK